MDTLPAPASLQDLLHSVGAETRLDDGAVFFRVVLMGLDLQSVLARHTLTSAAGYAVGKGLLKFHDPPELAYLSLLSTQGLSTREEFLQRIKTAHDGLRVRLGSHHDLLARAGLRPQVLPNRPVVVGHGHSAGFDFHVQVEAGPRLLLVAAGRPGAVLPIPLRLRPWLQLPTLSADQPHALLDQVGRFCTAHADILLQAPVAPQAVTFGLLGALVPASVPPAPVFPFEAVAPTWQPLADLPAAAPAVPPNTPLPVLEATPVVPAEPPAPPPPAPAPEPPPPSNLHEETPITDEVAPSPRARRRRPRDGTRTLRMDPLEFRPELTGRTEDTAQPTPTADPGPAEPTDVRDDVITGVLVLAQDVARVRHAFRAVRDLAFPVAVMPLDAEAPLLLRLCRPSLLLLEDRAKDLDDVLLGELAAEVHAHGGVVVSYVEKGSTPRLPVLHFLAAPVTEVRLRRVVKAARRGRNRATTL